MSKRKIGKVYLVGAGPGDPSLLTLKGKSCLEIADVVLYDFLSNSKLLQYTDTQAEIIFVGKKAGSHSLKQEEITDLIIKKALQGKVVVRLKGGDPLVFGRGGEEALELEKNKIAYEIVPGITSGIAALSYAGIPLTHRDLAVSAAFITGHEMDGKTQSGVDWKALTGINTLVFYMGVKNLKGICDNLIQAGRDESTPAAIVRWGTLSCQQTITASLGRLYHEAEQNKIKAPALIIIGEVVKFREKMNWFEGLPLFGKRILVTRSRTQSSSLVERLMELGADVIEFPTIEIKPLDDYQELHEEFSRLKRYSWLVFTSVNGVDIFFEQLALSGRDSRNLSGIKMAVIGQETGRVLRQYGIKADLVPAKFTSEGIVETMKASGMTIPGQSFFIPGSNIARDYVPRELIKMGAKVKTLAIYKNEIPGYSQETLSSIIEPPVDYVTFTSSSTVKNFYLILKQAAGLDKLSNMKIASIGPVTSAAAGQLGLSVDIEAEVHTIDCLVDTITAHILKENT